MRLSLLRALNVEFADDTLVSRLASAVEVAGAGSGGGGLLATGSPLQLFVSEADGLGHCAAALFSRPDLVESVVGKVRQLREDVDRDVRATAVRLLPNLGAFYYLKALNAGREQHCRAIWKLMEGVQFSPDEDVFYKGSEKRRSATAESYPDTQQSTEKTGNDNTEFY